MDMCATRRAPSCRAAAANDEAARLEAEADAMASQAVGKRQELHRLRVALEALCSNAPPRAHQGGIVLQQDVHCHVQSVAHGNVHVQQHTIHAARTLATPPSATSNSGHWHIDTQQGVVTVVSVSPEPTARHQPVVIAPVCTHVLIRWSTTMPQMVLSPDDPPAKPSRKRRAPTKRRSVPARRAAVDDDVFGGRFA